MVLLNKNYQPPEYFLFIVYEAYGIFVSVFA